MLISNKRRLKPNGRLDLLNAMPRKTAMALPCLGSQQAAQHHNKWLHALIGRVQYHRHISRHDDHLILL